MSKIGDAFTNNNSEKGINLPEVSNNLLTSQLSEVERLQDLLSGLRDVIPRTEFNDLLKTTTEIHNQLDKVNRSNLGELKTSISEVNHFIADLSTSITNLGELSELKEVHSSFNAIKKSIEELNSIQVNVTQFNELSNVMDKAVTSSDFLINKMQELQSVDFNGLSIGPALEGNVELLGEFVKSTQERINEINELTKNIKLFDSESNKNQLNSMFDEFLSKTQAFALDLDGALDLTKVIKLDSVDLTDVSDSVKSAVGEIADTIEDVLKDVFQSTLSGDVRGLVQTLDSIKTHTDEAFNADSIKNYSDTVYGLTQVIDDNGVRFVKNATNVDDYGKTINSLATNLNATAKSITDMVQRATELSKLTEMDISFHTNVPELIDQFQEFQIGIKEFQNLTSEAKQAGVENVNSMSEGIMQAFSNVSKVMEDINETQVKTPNSDNPMFIKETLGLQNLGFEVQGQLNNEMNKVLTSMDGVINTLDNTSETFKQLSEASRSLKQQISDNEEAQKNAKTDANLGAFNNLMHLAVDPSSQYTQNLDMARSISYAGKMHNGIQGAGVNAEQIQYGLLDLEYDSSMTNKQRRLTESVIQNPDELSGKAAEISRLGTFLYSNMGKVQNNLNSAVESGDENQIARAKQEAEELLKVQEALNSKTVDLTKLIKIYDKDTMKDLPESTQRILQHIKNTVSETQESNKAAMLLAESLGLSHDELKALNAELGNSQDKLNNMGTTVGDVFGGITGGIKSAIDMFTGPLGMIAGVAGMVGIGGLSLSSAVSGGASYANMQGQMKYDAAQADLALGIPTNQKAIDDRVYKKGAFYSNITGGLIPFDGYNKFYTGLSKGVGGRQDYSGEQTASDLSHMTEELYPMAKALGVSDSTMQDSIKTLYQDLKMTSSEVVQAISNMSQAAQSSNIPIEKYINQVSNLARSYRYIGLNGKDAQNIMNNLVNKGIAYDDAFTIGTQTGNAMNKWADNKSSVAYYGMLSGQFNDPWSAIGSAAFSHNEHGQIRKEWSDEIANSMDAQIGLYGSIAKDNPALQFSIVSDQFREMGYDRKNASMLTSAYMKGDREVFRDLLQEIEEGKDNQTVQLEDKDDYINALSELKGQLSEFQLFNNDIQTQTYRFGESLEDIAENVLPMVREGFMDVTNQMLGFAKWLADFIDTFANNEKVKQVGGIVAEHPLESAAAVVGGVVGGSAALKYMGKKILSIPFGSKNKKNKTKSKANVDVDMDVDDVDVKGHKADVYLDAQGNEWTPDAIDSKTGKFKTDVPGPTVKKANWLDDAVESLGKAKGNKYVRTAGGILTLAALGFGAHKGAEHFGVYDAINDAKEKYTGDGTFIGDVGDLISGKGNLNEQTQRAGETDSLFNLDKLSNFDNYFTDASYSSHNQPEYTGATAKNNYNQQVDYGLSSNDLHSVPYSTPEYNPIIPGKGVVSGTTTDTTQSQQPAPTTTIVNNNITETYTSPEPKAATAPRFDPKGSTNFEFDNDSSWTDDIPSYLSTILSFGGDAGGAALAKKIAPGFLKMPKAGGIIGAATEVAAAGVELGGHHFKGDAVSGDGLKFLLDTIFQGGGSIAGGALGAAGGSLVAPVAGTVGGGIAGSMAGGIVGSEISSHLYEKIMGASYEDLENRREMVNNTREYSIQMLQHTGLSRESAETMVDGLKDHTTLIDTMNNQQKTVLSTLIGEYTNAGMNIKDAIDKSIKAVIDVSADEFKKQVERIELTYAINTNAPGGTTGSKAMDVIIAGSAGDAAKEESDIKAIEAAMKNKIKYPELYNLNQEGFSGEMLLEAHKHDMLPPDVKESMDAVLKENEKKAEKAKEQAIDKNVQQNQTQSNQDMKQYYDKMGSDFNKIFASNEIIQADALEKATPSYKLRSDKQRMGVKSKAKTEENKMLESIKNEMFKAIEAGDENKITQLGKSYGISQGELTPLLDYAKIAKGEYSKTTSAANLNLASKHMDKFEAISNPLNRLPSGSKLSGGFASSTPESGVDLYREYQENLNKFKKDGTATFAEAKAESAKIAEKQGLTNDKLQTYTELFKTFDEKTINDNKTIIDRLVENNTSSKDIISHLKNISENPPKVNIEIKTSSSSSNVIKGPQQASGGVNWNVPSSALTQHTAGGTSGTVYDSKAAYNSFGAGAQGVPMKSSAAATATKESAAMGGGDSGPGNTSVQNGTVTGDYADLINYYANMYGMDPVFIAAVMQGESGFNPNSLNNKNKNGSNDLGLMQLNNRGAGADIAKPLINGKADPTDPRLDPETSIKLGTEFLAGKYKIATDSGLSGEAALKETYAMYNSGKYSVGSSSSGAYTNANRIMGHYRDFGGQANITATGDPSSYTAGDKAPQPYVSQGDAMVAAAMGQIGKPYVWGAETPEEGFDCSGLVSYAANMAGMNTGRLTADGLMNSCTTISENDLQPGDLGFDIGSDGKAFHVAIYTNEGWLDAPMAGKNVGVNYSKDKKYARYGRLKNSNQKASDSVLANLQSMGVTPTATGSGTFSGGSAFSNNISATAWSTGSMFYDMMPSQYSSAFTNDPNARFDMVGAWSKLRAKDTDNSLISWGDSQAKSRESALYAGTINPSKVNPFFETASDVKKLGDNVTTNASSNKALFSFNINATTKEEQLKAEEIQNVVMTALKDVLKDYDIAIEQTQNSINLLQTTVAGA